MADTLFTHGPPNVTTLLTTTIENRRGAIADAVFSNLVLFDWLYSKDKITVDGGASIVVPLMTASNSTAGFYDGYDLLNTTPQEGFTTAQYKWKQAAVSITVSGREDRIQNSGSSAVHSLIDAKQKQAEMSLKNTINTKLFGASNTSKEITSLVTLVDATTTIGDINSTTQTYWQATSTASGSFAAQGLADMRTIWFTLEQRNPVGGPELLLTTSTVFGYYEGSLQPQQRYNTSDNTGNGSFEGLKFKSGVVKHDPQATSGVMYFLHSGVLELYVSSSTDFILSEWVKPSNQDAKVAQLMVGLELATSNRRKLGKLTGITA